VSVTLGENDRIGELCFLLVMSDSFVIVSRGGTSAKSCFARPFGGIFVDFGCCVGELMSFRGDFGELSLDIDFESSLEGDLRDSRALMSEGETAREELEPTHEGEEAREELEPTHEGESERDAELIQDGDSDSPGESFLAPTNELSLDGEFLAHVGEFWLVEAVGEFLTHEGEFCWTVGDFVHGGGELVWTAGEFFMSRDEEFEEFDQVLGENWPTGEDFGEFLSHDSTFLM